MAEDLSTPEGFADAVSKLSPRMKDFYNTLIEEANVRDENDKQQKKDEQKKKDSQTLFSSMPFMGKLPQERHGATFT